jgi:hypothetical protein
MSGQPDMILQFAHYLAEKAQREGRPGVQVHANVTASLNGRDPQVLIDPQVDLAATPRNLRHSAWIVPLHTPLPPRALAHEQDDSDE